MVMKQTELFNNKMGIFITADYENTIFNVQQSVIPLLL